MSVTAWEILIVVLVFKIPLVYIGWIVWWAIKAEPIPGTEGEAQHTLNWQPWRRDPDGTRPRRGGPHSPRLRGARRRARAEG